MADKKDNKSPDKGTKPPMSTSSSLDEPLLDENTAEITAEIDTSHLSTEENNIATQKSKSLDDDFDLNVDISIDETATGEDLPDFPTPEQDSNESYLNIQNPLADITSSGPPVIETAAASSSRNKADDEELLLHTDITDAEFDKGIQDSGTDKSTTDSNSKFDDEKTSNSPIKSILDAVKKPESIVRRAWSNSSARRYLINNIDSYREKDEDQNMEEVIEKLYGGETAGKIAPGKFFKENLLFSFLVLILLFLIGWKAAGILFPNVMPAINDQIIETVQKQTFSKPKTKAVGREKAIATNNANKEMIDNTLSHCLIEPDARIQFTSAFSKVGYEYSNKSLTLSYEETRDSIKVWDNMNMDFYIKDAIFRFRELAILALPVIQDAHKAVADYSRSLMQISEQAKELETNIRELKTSGGNQSTDTINKRIPLRNKLGELQLRLAEEPDQERFKKLLAQLDLVERILSGDNKPERLMPDQVTESDPEWLMSITETVSSDIGISIEEKVIPAVQIPTDKLKNVNPKLTAFHLSELESALDDVLKLSSLITYLPENQLIPYKLELSGLNRRLNKLMKKELPEWISINRCLTSKRSGVLATPD